jgi:hypothetical protein
MGVSLDAAKTNYDFRKDKQVNPFLARKFLWSEGIDAAADVYNGVSGILFYFAFADTTRSSFFGQY